MFGRCSINPIWLGAGRGVLFLYVGLQKLDMVLDALTAMVAAAPAWANDLIMSMGYVGIFFASMVASASVLFPLPLFVLVPALGAAMNPILVGVSAGIGSSFGELTGYAIGRGGGKVIERKYKKSIKEYGAWFRHKRAFYLVVLFAATPLPDDILGIVCGIFGYDVRKFLAASIIGKVALNTALALAGFYGVQWFAQAFGGGL